MFIKGAIQFEVHGYESAVRKHKTQRETDFLVIEWT